MPFMLRKTSPISAKWMVADTDIKTTTDSQMLIKKLSLICNAM